MKPFDLIMVNMSTLAEWDRGRRNRNYYLVREWEKHPAVRTLVSIDFFPISWKYALRDVLRARFWPHRGEAVYRSTFSIVRKSSAKRYDCSTIANIVSPRQFVSELQHAVRATGVSEPILWLTNPLHTEMLGTLGESHLVFDAVDNWMHHQNYRHRRAELEENYRMIGERADCIFGVSEPLLRELFPTHPRAKCIPNGVDAALFSPGVAVNARIASLPSPRIGYLGVIEERFDVDLVEGVAEGRPEFSLIIAGMIWNPLIRKRLLRHPNITLIDHYVSGQDVPALVNAFDVVMIPHLQNALTAGMNPMKIYEALALGKPIVSTPVPGVEMFPDLIRVAEGPENFAELLQEEYQTDSPEKRRARRERILHESWESRVSAMAQEMAKMV